MSSVILVNGSEIRYLTHNTWFKLSSLH